MDAVACLILHHNQLGDEGCVELFEYLRSDKGRRHEVSAILLNSNNLGNVALEAIGNFLRGNEYLRDLYLANVGRNIPHFTAVPLTLSVTPRTISSATPMP